MIFRLSHKLGTKIKSGLLPERGMDGNPFADWSCHLFTADRTQYIIASNTASLYSCVMYGKGITDKRRFIERTLNSMREFMDDDGQTFAYHRFIAPATDSVNFAKALNRSVTGSLNELVKFAQYYLIEGSQSPHEVSFTLNDILLSAIARSKSDGYAKPREAFTELLERHPDFDPAKLKKGGNKAGGPSPAE